MLGFSPDYMTILREVAEHYEKNGTDGLYDDDTVYERGYWFTGREIKYQIKLRAWQRKVNETPVVAWWPPKCECGAEKSGAWGHYDWCPLYRKGETIKR
jgi:hypothetical protein